MPKRGWGEPDAGDGLREGDVMLLQAGDLVPADLDLVEATGLEVDEWELTGALAPVEKRVGGEAGRLYRGSRVTRGSGKGAVVATGEETEYGEILKQPWEQEKRKPPRLAGGKYLILPALLLPALAAALVRHDQDAVTCMAFLAAAVVLVLLQNGELFRYILTSLLARRLEARGIEIRDASCLGVVSHVDVVCLDKTGVLTTLEIKVGGIYFAGEVDGAPSLPDDARGVLTGTGCALCNDVFFPERWLQADPIDRGLISFAEQHGFDIARLGVQYKRIYDKPFDSDDRYMAAGFEVGDQRLYFAKGDPEVILKMCSGYMTAQGSVSRMDGAFLRSIRSAADAANQQGEIAIALAYSPGSTVSPKRYTFLCLLRLQNPARPGARDEVRKLDSMGIRPIMLTGDRSEAAMAVGRQVGIGLDSRYCLTGTDIARMPLREVTRQAADVSVFARLLPSQKGVLVRLLQERGHCVAMVGDGANDTVALRAADVGLSFGESSSPFAKRVSRILIHHPADFLTIVTGARHMDRWLKWLAVLRIATAVSVLSGWTWWVLR